MHASDCAVHNEPAYLAGECDCVPTMPDSFMPEMTTKSYVEGEMRIGVAYDESTGGRFELGYVLSMRSWPEGRERQPQADAALRYSLWLAMHGVDFTPSPMRHAGMAPTEESPEAKGFAVSTCYCKGGDFVCNPDCYHP